MKVELEHELEAMLEIERFEPPAEFRGEAPFDLVLPLGFPEWQKNGAIGAYCDVSGSPPRCGGTTSDEIARPSPTP